MQVERTILTGTLCFLMMSFITLSAQAEMVLFTDPAGDGIHGGGVYPYDPLGDVSSVLLDFDTTTGDYTATWTAYANNPFAGDLDLFLNLRDDTIAGGTNVYATLSTNFVGVAPTTVLTHSGNDTDLMNWSIGDTIVSKGNFGSGGIGSGGFGSGLHYSWDTSYSYYFYDRLWQATDSYVTASSVVPVPGAVLLGMLGLSVAGIKLRKFA